MGKDITTPRSFCWHCGHEFTLATEVSNNSSATVDPGDIAVCIDCGAISIYNDDLTQRELTGKEKHDLMKSESWTLVKKAVAAVHAVALKPFH